MNNFYPLILTTIAGAGAMLGNLFLFVNKKYKGGVLAFSLGISSSVMLVISIVELIPEGMLLIRNQLNIFSIILSFILLFIGYILVLFIDKKIDTDDSLYRVGVLSSLGLLIHNVPEGIICAVTSYSNLTLGLKMCFIIMIHNIMEGIAICLPIYYSTGSRLKAFLSTLVSSGGEFVGALITILFLKPFITSFMLYIVLLITAGIMISLSVGKIFKEGLSYCKHKYFVLGIVLGIIIVLFTL